VQVVLHSSIVVLVHEAEVSTIERHSILVIGSTLVEQRDEGQVVCTILILILVESCVPICVKLIFTICLKHSTGRNLLLVLNFAWDIVGGLVVLRPQTVELD
jgi:hypothetical protein